jgi:hypothetical protein
LRKQKPNCDLGDLFFIFADKVYEPYLTPGKFKALLNFYSLLYDKILIPDSFFINNKHLRLFLQSEDGLEYTKNCIVIPTVRSGVKNLKEVYELFLHTGTLGVDKSPPHLDVLEEISLDHAIEWDLREMASSFLRNIYDHIDALNMIETDKTRWLECVQEQTTKEIPTRSLLYRITDSFDFQDANAKSLLKRYVDICYGFNIPTFLGTSAAYPDIILTGLHGLLSPQRVFFGNRFSNSVAAKEEYIHTCLFNEGILSYLNVEQIRHIRQQKEYTTYLKCLRKSTSNQTEQKLENALFDFIYMFETELPLIVSREIKEQANKEKRKLRIQTLGRETLSQEGTSTMIELFLDGVGGFVGGKLIGSIVNIMLRPFSRKTERRLKKLEIEGKREVEKLKNDKNIYDTMRSFSLNTLK